MSARAISTLSAQRVQSRRQHRHRLSTITSGSSQARSNAWSAGRSMPNRSVRLLAQETTFYLCIDPVQPPLGKVGLLLVRRDLGLKLLDPVFSSVKLMRQLLRFVHCLPSVALGNVRGPSDKLQDRLAGLIELIVAAFRFSIRSNE